MYICLARNKEYKKKRVFFVEDINDLNLTVEDFRISPIFPVEPSFSKNPCDLSDYYILFCFPKNSFSTIGRLCAKLNDNRVGTLWFNHGLASLIVLSDSKVTIETILDCLGDDIIGHESWTIKKNIVEEKSIKMESAPPPSIDFPKISDLSAEVQALLLESFACMKTALTRAAVYLPCNLRVLQDLHCRVVVIINAIKYIHTEDPAENLNTDFLDLNVIKSHPDKKLQVSKNLIDYILQINSYLSYVLTQGYSGIAPIEEHECPIRSFSFLGTGTAFSALCKIYESTSKIFSKYPVPRLIKDNYETDFPQIPIFKNFAEYQVDEWKKYSGIIDEKLKKFTTNDGDSMFHLSFFSGTRGFKETLYSISAALQTITSCSLPRWSLVTLTHEYLHAHIRAIIAVLHQESTIEEFEPIYDQFISIGTNSEDPLKISLRKRLLFIIIASCESNLTFTKAAKKLREGKSGEEPQKLYAAEGVLAILKSLDKEINEYLVHTLDFLYFYEGNKDLYIRLIWLTWSTLPEIYGRLSHYLLRTILAISVNERGDIKARFLSSCKKIIDVFEGMVSLGDAEDVFVIQEALDKLKNPIELAALMLEFNGSVRMVDLANNFLYSATLHKEIKLDSLQGTDEKDNPFYPIQKFDFLDQDIQSPIAFIVDQAKKRLNSPEMLGHEEILKESCWELLVVSSSEL